jgi:hypothetical protein
MQDVTLGIKLLAGCTVVIMVVIMLVIMLTQDCVVLNFVALVICKL